MAKQIFYKCGLVALLLLGSFALAKAQRLSLTTSPPLAGGNGSDGITFNIQASGSTVIIDSLWCGFYGTTAGNVDVWYRTTPINGTPPALSTANGWIKVGTGTITPAQTSITSFVLQKIPLGINVKIPKGSTYGWCITYANIIYTTYVSGVSNFSDANITVQTGTNVGYGASTFVNHPRQFNGKVVYRRPATNPDNASVESLVSPVNFCAGNQDVKVKLVNNGNNKINSVQVNWQLDGVTQTALNYTTPIDTFGSTAGNIAVVTLGTVNFTSTKKLKVWTSSPNGKTDTDKSDDTLNATLAPALSGNYTIDKTGSGVTNFKSFKEAATALTSFGVCGPVKFTVAAGTYTEAVEIGNISGASSTNTIVFDGVDKATRTLTSAGTAVGSSTLKLNGADYVTVKNLTISNTGASYGYGVHLTGKADYNTFDNCNISVSTTTTSTYHVPFGIFGATYYYDAGDNGNYNTVQNCKLDGGYFNAVIYGSSTSALCLGNRLISNELTNAYYYGIYSYYQQENEFNRNKVTIRPGTVSTYGIVNYYGVKSKIDGNTIRSYYMGIYNYYNNYYVTGGRTLISNNMIYGQQASTSYQIYSYYSNNTDIFHNSLYFTATNGYTLYLYYGSGSKVMNNIFSKLSNNTYASYVTPTSAVSAMDYNDYYSTGGNYVYFGAAYANLAALKAANALYNQKSINLQPKFVSTTSGSEDLHWVTTQPAPSGIDVGVKEDLDGDSRCAAFPTMGADESTIGKGKPVVKFYPPSVIYENSWTLITNSAKPDEPKLHQWFVDGKFVSDSSVLYTKFTGTTAKVKLKTVGCGGTDSFEQNITITKPTQIPQPEFIANRNNIIQGQTVRFQDLTDYGPTSYLWEITPDSTYDGGNKVARYVYTFKDATYPNPEVRFDYPGVYKVCLTAANSKGTSSANCKVAYITVSTSINLGKQTVVRDSTGMLYDDGGPEGAYSASFNKGLLIDPCAEEVYLVINKFDLECGYDFLRIYDGADKTGKPLHRCTTNTNGAYGPGFTGGPSSTVCATNCQPSLTDTFVAKSGKMYIEMGSDASGQYSGFEAKWWSKPKQQPKPDAAFTAPDTACVNSVINFTNTTKGDDVTFYWDLDGDLSTFECTGTCKSAIYPYFFPGTYTITLIAENCGGIDTFTKDVYIKTPPSPMASFTVDNTNPTTNDVVFFKSDVQECVDEYMWKFEHKYGTGKAVYVNGTKATSANPQIVFSDTGCYAAQLYVKNVSGDDSLKLNCFVRVRNAYCIPSVSELIADIGISQVEINSASGTILSNKSSQGVSEYQNFTPSVSATLEVGVEYELVVGRTTNNNKITRTAWVDWNRDGQFSATEKIGEETNAATMSWKQKFTVPSSASLGATVIRIAINQGKQSNTPCGQNLYGEYEDYRLYITPDLTAPVITLLGEDTVILEQGYGYVDSGATAWDNLNGNITANIKTTEPKAGFDLIPGTYKYIYNVQDAAGNKAKTVTRVVIITSDKTPPVLEIEKPDTIYLAVGKPFTMPKVLVAQDLVDGNMSGDVTIINPVDITVVDTYTVVFSLIDVSQNAVSVTRTVIVLDSIKPVITLNGSTTVNHEVNTPYTDAGATITDNYYSNTVMNPRLVMTSNLDVSRPGTYVVLYNAIDPSGNKANTVTRIVNVVDTKAPVITLNGDTVIQLEVFSTYREEGWMAVDNYAVASKTISGTFYQKFAGGKATELGTYTIVYEAKDSAGNTATVTRTIMVVDTKAPVITLVGAEDVVLCRWDKYTDAGYTLSDNYYANTQIKVDTLGTFVNTQLSGFYTRYYRATDLSNNTSTTVKRTIWVRTPEACGTSINENTTLNSRVTVYPNPSAGTFILNLNGEVKGQVMISVTNMLGQEVASFTDNNVMDRNIRIELDNQPSGMYMLNITAENQKITRRIIISR